MTAPRRKLIVSSVAAFLIVGGLAYAFLTPAASPVLALGPEPTEATEEQVRAMCVGCHVYPPPDSFPKSVWRKEVKQAFDFFHDDPKYRTGHPSLESVTRYYEARAPESLPYAPRISGLTPPVSFERKIGRPVPGGQSPGIAFVEFVTLTKKPKLDLIACDASNKTVLLLPDADPTQSWKTLASGLSTVHAEVTDLDGDGIKDILLAVIGSFYATDDRVGSVVLLRGKADRTYTPITLVEGLGRVADVRVGDFTGTGRKDLVIAEFGWHKTGSILIAENRTTDWGKPNFVTKVLDPRHGATHVPVVDINGDGKPDVVAVIGQEHEAVVAFVNDGKGGFKTETVYEAPHPASGVNGIAFGDLNADGKTDIVLTNGDSLDPPYILRPDHGVTVLENKGSFPFAARRIADVYGAGGPVIADFDGNGRPDIAVVSFLPGELFPSRAELRLDSVVLLDQYEPGKFARYSLETATCDHLTAAAGDANGDGKPDLAVGGYVRVSGVPPVIVWSNLGKPAPRK